jgi:anti-anti-sigma factor
MALQVTEEVEGTTTTLRLAGDLDLGSVLDFETRLMHARRSSERVVVDLRRLDFLDSTGVGALISAHQDARVEGVELVILQGPPAVQRVFELSGIVDELPFGAAQP